MYQIVELLRKMVDDVEYKELSEADWQRATIIRDILYLEDNEVRGVKSWVSGCAIPRGKQKGKKKTRPQNEKNKQEHLKEQSNYKIDYKKKTIELLEKIEQEDILKRIYRLTKYLYIYRT